MKLTTRFIESKPRWIEWLYILAFSLCLLIATPFLALAFVSEICVCIGKAIIQFASDKLDIDFTL